VADIVRAGEVIAYPTDSCYVLGCQFGDKDGIERIRSIRHLEDQHRLTLVCRDFAQLALGGVLRPLVRSERHHGGQRDFR
jgi:tRNA A37 threonylcarbamoyladenosine synthetase subunit TsaC/SUA5/YrdC